MILQSPPPHILHIKEEENIHPGEPPHLTPPSPSTAANYHRDRHCRLKSDLFQAENTVTMTTNTATETAAEVTPDSEPDPGPAPAAPPTGLEDEEEEEEEVAEECVSALKLVGGQCRLLFWKRRTAGALWEGCRAEGHALLTE